jgi:hypothetical protein
MTFVKSLSFFDVVFISVGVLRDNMGLVPDPCNKANAAIN